jgi:hypothetical protein
MLDFPKTTRKLASSATQRAGVCSPSSFSDGGKLGKGVFAECGD